MQHKFKIKFYTLFILAILLIFPINSIAIPTHIGMESIQQCDNIKILKVMKKVMIKAKKNCYKDIVVELCSDGTNCTSEKKLTKNTWIRQEYLRCKAIGSDKSNATRKRTGQCFRDVAEDIITTMHEGKGEYWFSYDGITYQWDVSSPRSNKYVDPSQEKRASGGASGGSSSNNIGRDISDAYRDLGNAIYPNGYAMTTRKELFEMGNCSTLCNRAKGERIDPRNGGRNPQGIGGGCLQQIRDSPFDLDSKTCQSAIGQTGLEHD